MICFILSVTSNTRPGTEIIFDILHDCSLMFFLYLFCSVLFCSFIICSVRSFNILCLPSIAGLDGINEDVDEGEEMDEEVAAPVVPRVDADGWETVIRGTKKTGKKK